MLIQLLTHLIGNSGDTRSIKSMRTELCTNRDMPCSETTHSPFLLKNIQKNVKVKIPLPRGNHC